MLSRLTVAGGSCGGTETKVCTVIAGASTELTLSRSTAIVGSCAIGSMVRMPIEYSEDNGGVEGLGSSIWMEPRLSRLTTVSN